MNKKILASFFLMMMLTGCKASEEKQTVSETEASVSETQVKMTEAETETETVTEAPEPISPLHCGKKQSGYNNEKVSVTAEIKGIASSLYYPDIVAEMGENPEMFVIETEVKAKNLTYEDISFDCSQLSLVSEEGNLYLFDTECAEGENMPSGDSIKMTMRYLCTLTQADSVEGFLFNGETMETAEKFLPESFGEVIEIQSADDVRDYLYRQFVIHRYEDHYLMRASAPAAIEAHVIGRTGENDEYIAVKYMVYNRSDYALLLKPAAFEFDYLTDADMNSNEEIIQMKEAEAVCVSTDEELIYQPEEADIKIKGMKKMYEMPDFMCMNPEGETAFTVIYKADPKIVKWALRYDMYYEEKPYYAVYESIHMVTSEM